MSQEYFWCYRTSAQQCSVVLSFCRLGLAVRAALILVILYEYQRQTSTHQAATQFSFYYIYFIYI